MSSGTVPRPLDLGMISIRQDIQVSRTGSAPTSPKTSVVSSGSSTGKHILISKSTFELQTFALYPQVHLVLPPVPLKPNPSTLLVKDPHITMLNSWEVLLEGAGSTVSPCPTFPQPWFEKTKGWGASPRLPLPHLELPSKCWLEGPNHLLFCPYESTS